MAEVRQAAGKIKRPFIKEHWGALQMLLTDPDGREIAVEARVEGEDPRK
jgi:uncharacterized glyoxalase superfamily protein PhnB